jgi:hypothetical protein
MLVLLAPNWARAEDARLPYQDLCLIQKAQVELSRRHTNLTLVLQMRSTNPNVKPSDIRANIDTKSGKIPILIGNEGAFMLPTSDELMAEAPSLIVNQPKGTMELSWHAGLSASLVRQMTNAIHYSPLMRAVRECDDVQEAMRRFFPHAPRLSAAGLRLTFHSSAIVPGAIIHAKDGDRRLFADNLGELIIPIDADLMEEDPVIKLTESPFAVEIVTRRLDPVP